MNILRSKWDFECKYLLDAVEVLLELLLDVVVHADLDLVLHHALHVELDFDHLSTPGAFVQHALGHGLGELWG